AFRRCLILPIRGCFTRSLRCEPLPVFGSTSSLFPRDISLAMTSAISSALKVICFNSRPVSHQESCLPRNVRSEKYRGLFVDTIAQRICLHRREKCSRE